MINFFKKYFPTTYKYIGLIIPGVALLAINYQWLIGIKIPDLFLQILTYLGLILTILPFLLLSFEFLAKLLPIFSGVLNVLIKIINFVINIYSWLIKILIKRSVISILEEKKNLTSEDFTLKSSAGADESWSRSLDFVNIKVLKLEIKPNANYDYWRLGFKFSANNTFSTARFSNDNSLLHLTKNTSDNSLLLDYYNQANPELAFRSKKLIEAYNNSLIFLKIGLIRHKNVINIEICNDKGKAVFNENLPLDGHRYAQLFAWGDGKEYEINVKNFIEMKA